MADRAITFVGRFTVVPGSLPGIGRPSLHAVVLIEADAKRNREEINRVDAGIKSLLPPSPEPSQVAQPPQLPGSLLVWNRHVQEAAGWPTSIDGVVEQSTPRDQPDRCGIAVPFLEGCAEEAAQALTWVIDVVNDAVSGKAIAATAARLGPLLERLRRVGPQGMNTSRFLAAANRMGIPTRRVVGNVYQFGHGAEARWLDSSYTDQSACIASSLARHKFDAAIVLRRAGVPVPRHEAATTAAAAVSAAERIGFPVVVKPVDRDGGKGVAVELERADAVQAAAEAALRLSSTVLVEQFIPGNDYRLQVHRGEVIWASHRVPGGVSGDGVHSVVALLAALNADPLRGAPGSAALLKKIPLDAEASDLLARQGLAPDAVPEAGRFVRLRRAANVASGGRAVGVLEQVHPDNLALAARAAQALRLDLAGVDLLIPDISRSWLEGGAAVCEVNAQPQLWPTLPEKILGRLVRGDGRIPVVMVMGGADLAPWRAALNRRVAARGRAVGWAARANATLGGETIVRDPTSLLAAGEALLFDRRTQALVVAVEDEQILRTGMPCDRCDLLVLGGGPADDAAWPRWRGVAQFLAGACPGRIVAAADEPRWQPLAAALSGRLVEPLARGEIERIMMDTLLVDRTTASHPGSI
ncbi:MAG: acetate--CoA ligase family protein [Planctomycetia bacterium]